MLFHYFSVIQQHVDFPEHKITSLRILLMRTLIRVCQIFRLAFVQLVMLPWIHSRLFIIPGLCLLILLFLYRVLTKRLYQSQKYMKYLLRFMTLWTMLCLNGLVIHLILLHVFLNLLPGSIVTSGLWSFPFFTI